jgi:hypothetical protein
MYKKLFASSILAMLLSSGCYQARFDRATTFSDYKVEMYSGGELVRTWETSGKVISDGDDVTSYFKDKETGKLIEVSGDIVITEL